MSEQPPNAPTATATKRKINHWLLWSALLVPILFMGVMTLISMFGPKFDFISSTIIVGPFFIIVGWILAGVALFKRMPTAGYVVTLILYPILQTVVCFALFFVGCLSSLDGGWSHSAPDSWVEEQERLRKENPIDPVELEKAKQELEEHLRKQEELKKAESENDFQKIEDNLESAGEGIALPATTQGDNPLLDDN